MHRHSYERNAYTPSGSSGSDHSSSDSSRDGSDKDSKRGGGKGKKEFNAYNETRESGSAASLERKKASITRDMRKLETEQTRLFGRAAELRERVESAINDSIDANLNEGSQKAIGARAKEYETARDQHNTYVEQYNSSLNHLESRMTDFNGNAHNHNRSLRDRNNRVERIQESLDKVDKLESFDEIWEQTNTRNKRIFDERTMAGKGNYNNYDDGRSDGGGSAYDQYTRGGYGSGFGSGFDESDYI